MPTATATKERPLTLSDWEVRAVLEGRKSQLRRVCKDAIDPAMENAKAVCQCPADGSWIAWWGETPREGWQRATEIAYPNGGGFRCPFGKVGDRLWVREAWNVKGICFGRPISHSRIASKSAWRYAATDDGSWQHGWKPSIHMPRWASRLTLEIADIRIERLQEIGEEDAIAEGSQTPIAQLPKKARQGALTERTAFANIWKAIYGPGSWSANPFVWRIAFRRVE